MEDIGMGIGILKMWVWVWVFGYEKSEYTQNMGILEPGIVSMANKSNRTEYDIISDIIYDTISYQKLAIDDMI
jgi:hypothetical protein